MATPPPVTLEEWLIRNGLAKKATLSEIAVIEGTTSTRRIGIDANWVYMQSGLQESNMDRAWFLTSVYPSAIIKHFMDFSDQLRNYGVEAVFVFNGMLPAGIPPNDAHREARIEVQNMIRYVHDQIDANVGAPRRTNPTIPERFNPAVGIMDVAFDEEVENKIMRELNRKGIKAVRAPYINWPQMAVFMMPTARWFSDVVGAAEMLLYEPVERVIIYCDPAINEILYVQRSDVLAHIKQQLNRDVDLIMMGDMMMLFSQNPLIRPITGDYGYFEAQVYETQGPMHPMDLAISFMNGAEPQASLYSQAKRYLLPGDPVPRLGQYGFNQLRWILRGCPVLTPEADVLPCSKVPGFLKDPASLRTPSNLTILFGQYSIILAPVLFYLQFVGLLSPSTMQTVAFNRIYDGFPIVDTREFRGVLERIIPLRTQIIYQMVQALSTHPVLANPFHIHWMRAFSSRTIPILNPPSIKLDDWNVASYEDNRRSPTLATVISQFAKNAEVRFCYNTRNEVQAAIMLKALDLLGYFTHATHSNAVEVSGESIYATTLKTACQSNNRDWSEKGVLLIELLRTHSLTESKYQYLTVQQDGRVQSLMQRDDGNPQQAQVAAAQRFLTRVMSLVDVQLGPKWDHLRYTRRDLLAYNVMLRSLHRTLRSLCEVIAATTYLPATSGEPRSNQASPEIAKNLAVELPFSCTPGIAGGVVMDVILSTKDLSVRALQENFPPETCDVLGVTREIFEFWDVSLKIILSLSEQDAQTLSPELFQVLEACRILMEERKSKLRELFPAPRH